MRQIYLNRLKIGIMVFSGLVETGSHFLKFIYNILFARILREKSQKSFLGRNVSCRNLFADFVRVNNHISNTFGYSCFLLTKY